MPLQLKNEYSPDEINVMGLRDGQIARITAWGYSPDCIGRIVMRHDKNLLTIGGVPMNKLSEAYWPNSFPHTFNPDCRVRVLPNGTQLIVTGNE